MPSAEDARKLCVSLHDVAPATWTACQAILDWLEEFAHVPLSLLVVPRYHGIADFDADPAFCAAIERRLDRGDELVLHGYSHLDEGPPPATPWDYARRHWYTAGEGEFAALDEAGATQRLRDGLEAMASRAWPVRGFIAPAWMMNASSWRALRASPLEYTTVRGGVCRLGDGAWHSSPSLVYSVRAPWRRGLSRLWNERAYRSLRGNRLLRISLHPADAAHPGVLDHWRSLITRALGSRTPVTLGDFVSAWH
jgi:predicted deacetylase